MRLRMRPLAAVDADAIQKLHCSTQKKTTPNGVVFLFGMVFDIGLEEDNIGKSGAKAQVKRFSACGKGLPLRQKEAALKNQLLGSVRMVTVVITG